ncbi:hypothetical protein AKJ65_03710 [candidate division MSBL1 archaeon SCGC-AAA259E19]|uniref:MIP18 family-like domain-containing protein n=1 Tax=candidate division MSBL1 archaeon SCGC-AAA259E19 TaxID=1698264 RepID=A0A133UKF7_9EURY|nr:hypothetical protein AKJ65_03710 [candidate division MSBL1 archaeon SCGC-AAA259E19]
MIEEEEVWEKLEKVEDPEFGTSMVEMGLIDSVKIKDETVQVRFHLTAPMCPPTFALDMGEQIKESVSDIEGVESVAVQVKNHNRAEELNQRLEEG